MSLIAQKKFVEMFRTRVLIPAVGKNVDREQARDVIKGLADLITEILLRHDKVNFGRLGMFKAKKMPAGPRWNPATATKFTVGPHFKFVFVFSKCFKALIKEFESQ